MRAEGEYRVFGPPGTGKTTFLTKQLQRACKVMSPQDIVVCSFTTAAAHEIASRIEGVLPVRVGTLHSFCYRALGTEDIADSPKHLVEWNNKVHEMGLPMLSLGLNAGDPYSRLNTGVGQPLNEAFLYRAKLLSEDQWPSDVREAHKLWCEWKSENGWLDFTDLIEDCLSDVDAMPGNPELGFFDEVQDFSALELALVRKWAREMRQVVLAGDDDQSIYAFRGATPDAFLNPEIDEERKIFLKSSYRLPKVVKDYADKWISRVKNREIKEYEPLKEGGDVIRAPDLRFKNPRYLFQRIQKDLSESKEVMVLSTCGYMLNPLLSLLRQEGVMFYNPYRRSDKAWNPVDPNKGAAKRILSFLRPNKEVWADTRLWTWKELWDWLELIDIKKFPLPRGTKAIVKKLAYSDAKDETIKEDEVGAVLGQEEGCMVEFFLELVEQGNLSWLKPNMLRSQWNRSMEMSLRVAEVHGGAELRKVPKLCVGTIHSVKGGQADVVYVFPDLSGLGFTDSLNDPDSMIRLFYVGLTRAKEKVILCGGETSKSVQWI